MSDTMIQPYLYFAGNCEEAIEFYKKALGAEVEMLMRHKDNPEPSPEHPIPAGFEEKVMHASFKIGDHTIMASDGCGEPQKFEGFSLSLGVKTEGEADKAFNALADGGNVMMPLSKTFWSPKFGMVADRFGVGWMVSVITDCDQ